ncbi:uncharacterized protein LOC126908697 [Daktulosphaira vitifoliae]|uniref:uncharacterized protein LOC126908697 n=1 Tax=Daktulosphaira vitifoliae TaxID=58002 RepID=UPI0021AA51F1|nr:uncharacterized protein LOC126908697 [Daktulosphaira vitifoliae]
MFYKINSFLLIFMCGHFFEEVFGNILLIVGDKVFIDNTHARIGYHTDAKWIEKNYMFKPSKKYLQCGPLILYFVNENKIFAEIYLNFHDQITREIKKKEKLYFYIIFQKNSIILNYNGNDNIFEYNEEMNKKLQTFMEEINNRIQFKIIKIQTSKLDNNTSLINNTVYDEKTTNQLRDVMNLSLWKYIKEELVQSKVSLLPNTTINDFILNSTMYVYIVKSTLKKAITMMCDRTYKYAILLMVYAFEALRIDYCKTPYWDQLMNYLKKLSDILTNLNGDIILRRGLDDIKCGINECDKMCIFQRLVSDYYSNIYLKPQDREIFKLKNKSEWINIKDKEILSQNVLDKIFKGFPKSHKDEEPYKFELIPTSLCEIEKKFQQIYVLIDTEFERIYKIDL